MNEHIQNRGESFKGFFFVGGKEEIDYENFRDVSYFSFCLVIEISAIFVIPD